MWTRCYVSPMEVTISPSGNCSSFHFTNLLMFFCWHSYNWYVAFSDLPPQCQLMPALMSYSHPLAPYSHSTHTILSHPLTPYSHSIHTQSHPTLTPFTPTHTLLSLNSHYSHSTHTLLTLTHILSHPLKPYSHPIHTPLTPYTYSAYMECPKSGANGCPTSGILWSS